MPLSDISSLSSLTNFDSFQNCDKPIKGGEVGFDTFRQNELFGKIKEFDTKINGGNFRNIDDTPSFETKDHVIESMAISGGATPEAFEAASLMPVGTTRRTLSGSFKVGWDWKPGQRPQKKWFPVSYGYQSLPLSYRSYYPNTYYYGIS